MAKSKCTIQPGPDDVCCPGTHASYTTTDMLNALAFARAQVNMIKAADANKSGTDLNKKYCNGKTDCFQWKLHRNNQTWAPAQFKPSDLKSTDRTKPYPWETWTDWTTGGHIHIVDKDICQAAGQVPYECDSSGCDWVDKKKLTAPYTEWQTSMCFKSGDDIQCKTIGECISDENCSGQNTCVNGKCTCTADMECNGTSKCVNNVCETGKAGCFMGNFLLKQWCEEPISRCAKLSDGTFPKECEGSSTEMGVTDVPPFFYNTDNGSCYMTPDYCRRFGVNTNNTKECTTDTDCATVHSDAKCINQPDLNKKMCVGPTTDCESGSLWEMVVGKTLFRMWKSGVKCEAYENPTQNILEKLDKLPEKLEKLIDPKFIDNKVTLKKNFIPGIDLLMVRWNKKSGKETLNEMCFDSEQIKQKYPYLLSVKNNNLYLTISKSQIRHDPKLKQIYGILGLNKDLTQIFATYAVVKK